MELTLIIHEKDKDKRQNPFNLKKKKVLKANPNCLPRSEITHFFNSSSFHGQHKNVVFIFLRI